MALIAVSDLHIWGADDPLYAALNALLNTRAGKGDTVVLVGDIFDIWVGDKKIFVERYARFLDELRAAVARGADVHYIEGNHDFMLKRVLGRYGVRVHAKEYHVEIAGKKFCFEHGDLADKKDYGYQALRVLFRTPLMKGVFAAAPGRWIDRVGSSSSGFSRGARPLIPDDMKPEAREAFRKTYRNYAVERLMAGHDFVVLGHCHDLDELGVNVGGRQGQYINVGFPRAHGTFLRWAPGDEKIGREKLPDPAS